MTLTEEARRLQLQEEEERERKMKNSTDSLSKADYSLHAIVKSRGGRVELVSVEAHWDRGGPRFGVGGGPGLQLEWAAEGSDLRKGDRVIEVNGRIVPTASTWSREELNRALATKPAPAEMVVLR